MKNVMSAVLACLLATAPLLANAQELRSNGPPRPDLRMSTAIPDMSVAERKAAADQLIARWQSAALGSGVRDAASWTSAIRSLASGMQSEHIGRALTMTSLEDMQTALAGYQTEPGVADSAGGLSNASPAPRLVGSPVDNLVYTPLPRGRCSVSNFILPANTVRSIKIEDMASYAAQGGTGTYGSGNSSSACGIPTSTSGYLLSVSVLSPAATGAIKVFPYGTDRRGGGTFVYNTGGLGVSNEVIVQSCRICTSNLSVLVSTNARVLIEVIGYFNPPKFYSPICYTAASPEQTVAAGGTITVPTPVCNAGYTGTFGGCWSNTWRMNFAAFVVSQCSGYNQDSASAKVVAYQRCCTIASPY